MKLLSAPLFLSVAAAAAIQARAPADPVADILNTVAAGFNTLAGHFPADWVNGTVNLINQLSTIHAPTLGDYSCTDVTSGALHSLEMATGNVGRALGDISLQQAPTNGSGLPTSCSEAMGDISNMLGNFNFLMTHMSLAVNGKTNCNDIAGGVLDAQGPTNIALSRLQSVTC